jgi:HSP20 family protein
MEEIFNRYRQPLARGGAGKEYEGILSGNWVPAVDISETKDAYIIKGELPGVEKEDVDISIDNNLLSIRGEKKYEKTVDEDQTHRNECVYGAFERSFSLPKQVDINNVEAVFKNGILKLTVPKAEEAKPKQIQVKIS